MATDGSLEEIGRCAPIWIAYFWTTSSYPKLLVDNAMVLTLFHKQGTERVAEHLLPLFAIPVVLTADGYTLLSGKRHVSRFVPVRYCVLA